MLISTRTALNTKPVTKEYLKMHLGRRCVDLARIRVDRILTEALAVGPDPLHLSMMFNLSHGTASRYTAAAEALLSTESVSRTPANAPGNPGSSTKMR